MGGRGERERKGEGKGERFPSFLSTFKGGGEGLMLQGAGAYPTYLR